MGQYDLPFAPVEDRRACRCPSGRRLRPSAREHCRDAPPQLSLGHVPPILPALNPDRAETRRSKIPLEVRRASCGGPA